MPAHDPRSGPAARPTLRVEIVLPDGRSQHARYRGPRVTVGRDAGCELVLPSKSVSRNHAAIEWSSGELSVVDQSANGTVVDGDTVVGESRACGDRAELGIGAYRLKLRLERRPAPPRPAPPRPAPPRPAEWGPVRRKIHRELLEALDLAQLSPDAIDAEALRPRVLEALRRLLSEARDELPEGVDRQQLARELADEALGLGPLEPLLADPAVSEIMVVDPSTIFAERAGRIERTAHRFTDAESVRAVIERIVTPLGRRIDESAPLVDARLRDGSRVNAVIPPLAVKGPCITIRKFPKERLSLERLIDFGSLTEEMGALLQAAVRLRKNIVISGGTGSGKTTLLNVLSSAIPEQERIVTIEDAAELSLGQPHVVSLESRPPNMEGKGEYSIRDLVKNALRMRPDRIVVGECRGGEAIDMLQAMNTGHEGSMTTTHANSPREAVGRLETLCLMAGIDLPISAIRAQIASSVHLIVQQSRLSDGSRRVVSVAEVGALEDHGEIGLTEIYRFDRLGTTESGAVEGEFRATGFLPSFVGELAAHRVDLWGGAPCG